jgi:hypothetical protein
MMHAALVPVGLFFGYAEGRGVGTEFAAQETAGAKGKMEGTKVGVVNCEEGCLVE